MFNIGYVKNIVLILLCFYLFSCQNISNSSQASSLDSLSILIQNDPSSIDFLKQRASIYLKNNNLELAKTDIDHAYEIFKNDPELLLLRGDLYFLLNETRISKDSWQRCLELDANNIDCRQKLTELYCLVKDQKCTAMIDTLALLNNNLISLDLIVFLKEIKSYSKAVFFLNNLLSRSSDDKEVLSLLAIIHSDTSSFNNQFNVELADQYFSKLVRLYPKNKISYYNFGKYKQDIFQYNEALKLYSRYLELDTSNKYIYYNMGFCFLQLEDYNQSIKAFTEAINLDNAFLIAYHARAYLYELINLPEKAKIDWKNCLMLNPSYIPALEGLNK